MTSEELKEFRKVYTDIVVPQHVIEKKWMLQQRLLPEQAKRNLFYHFKPYSAVFAGAFVVLLIVSVGFVQAAKPGSFLYPVKAVTKQLTANATNTFQAELKNIVPTTIHKSQDIEHSIESTVTPTITPTQQPTEKIKHDSSSQESDETSHPELKHTDLHEIKEKIPTQVESPKDINNNNDSRKEINSAIKDVQGVSTENIQITSDKVNNDKNNTTDNNGHHNEDDK